MVNVHFISLDETYSIAFFPNTRKYFKVNSNGRYLIEAICNNMSYEDLKMQISIDKNFFTDYQGKVESYCKMHQKSEKSISPEMDIFRTQKKILPRLVIHVTNDCNLRCKYCYASGGAYGGSRSIITPDTLELIMNKFYNYFDYIQTVQIFGGEPLCNIEAVKSICDYVRKEDVKRTQNTRVCIVTNATLIDDEFISVVKSYSVNVTVSYDGSPLVNDLMRIYEDGSPTSADILRRTSQLYEATGQPDTIEVTYNQYHVENGVGILDVVSHIKSMFPKTGVHLVPVGGDTKSDYMLENPLLFADSIDDILSERNTEKLSYSLAERVFLGLNNNGDIKRYICDAGVGTLSVSTDGNVYPCFMFTNEDALCLGNLCEDDLFEGVQFRKGIGKLMKFTDKFQNAKCKECFMWSLCNGCLGLNARRKDDEFEIIDQTCDMFRQMVEHAIRQYYLHSYMTEKSETIGKQKLDT